MSSRRSFYTVSDDHIIVGIIRGVRGLKGELRVEPTTEFLVRFESGNTLFIKGVSHEVIRSQQGGKGIVLLLDGIRNRDDAEGVLGEQLTVPNSDGAPGIAESILGVVDISQPLLSWSRSIGKTHQRMPGL